MKILIYTHEFPPFLGGLATTSYKLARGIGDAGHPVTVLAPEYKANDSELDNGFNFSVIRMGRLARNHGIPSPIKEAKGFISLSNALSRIKPEAVIFVTREAHIAGGLLSDFPFRVIVRVAGYEAAKYLLGNKLNKRLLSLPMRRLYMKAHRIISPSDSTRELLEKAGIPRQKIQVIYNGVNADMLYSEPNPGVLEKLRLHLGILSDEKVILTVARLVSGKGQDTVITALPKILKKCDRFKYLIVGEGVHERELKDLAEREGVKSKIIFAGPVPHDEIINFYDLCDIFIMPNRTIKEKENIEGLPNVVLEAASRGKPIITGIPGGAKEVVEHGKTGYIANGEDPDEIAKYLIELIQDEPKARAFGSLGKRRIAEFLTEEKMINEYLKVLSA